MRRLLAALAALALGVVPAAVAAGSSKHHAKTHCAGKRNAKRHPRQCRRRKAQQQANHQATVVTTQPGSAPTADPGTAVPPAPPTAGAPGSSSPTNTASTRIGVSAREWTITLSRTSAGAGNALVQLQNSGEDAHNLRVERVDGSGTPVDFSSTDPGTQQTRTVQLAPGTYKLYCTLAGHDAAGMHAYLSVGG